MASSPSSLDQLDAGLAALRRFWDRPEVHSYLAEHIGELPEGLDASAFRVMRAVEAGGSPVSVGHVAEFLRIEASTASRLVDRAVISGAVARQQCRHDRRKAELVLTELGRSALDELQRVRTQLLGELTFDWDPREVEVLGDLATRLDAALHRLDAERSGDPVGDLPRGSTEVAR